jgi:hypothetical protein
MRNTNAEIYPTNPLFPLYSEIPPTHRTARHRQRRAENVVSRAENVPHFRYFSNQANIRSQ